LAKSGGVCAHLPRIPAHIRVLLCGWHGIRTEAVRPKPKGKGR